MKGSIERRGPNSFRLIVSAGLDGSGKQIKHPRLFKTMDGMTEKAKLAAADEALALFIADILKGNTAQSKGMTVSALWDYWIENHAKPNCETTSLLYYQSFRDRIIKALGPIRIDRIQPKHLLAFYKNLGEPGIKKLPTKKKKPATQEEQPAEPTPEDLAAAEKVKTAVLSPTTVKKYHIVLKNMFNCAIRWRLMDYNPAEKLTPPKAPAKEKKIYDLEMTGQMLTLLDEEEPRHKLMIMLGLTCGLRREEIFGLRWSDINLELRELSIKQVRVVAKGVITKSPKTAGSSRVISFPAELLPLFKSHSAAEAKKKLKLGEDWKGSDLLFTDWFGADLHPQSMNNFLWRFCRTHNLPPFQPHMLRHLAATFMTASGTDIKTVSAKLGHSRINITLDLYGHLLKSAEQKTAEVMGGVLSDARQAAKDAAEKKKSEQNSPDLVKLVK